MASVRKGIGGRSRASTRCGSARGGGADELRRRTEELQALLDLLPAFVWFTRDTRARVIHGNRAANELLGLPAGTNVSQTACRDHPGVPVLIRKPDGSEYRPDELPLQTAIATRRPVRDTYVEICLPEGRRVYTAGHAVPLFSRAGAVRGALAVMFDVTERKRAEQLLEQRVAERTAELRRRTRQLAQLAEELTLVEQRERRRLADRLHDHLQQILVGARMQVHALSSQAKPGGRRSLDRLGSALTEAIDAVSAMTQDMAPPVALRRRLPDAFRWLIHDMSERHRLEVRFSDDGTLDGVSEALGVLLFTAARELLLNVVKHAGTLRARLVLCRRDDSVMLDVRDAGRGYDPAAVSARTRRGFGLFSIRERSELLGGKLTVTSRPGHGTRAVLTVPLGGAAAPPCAGGRGASPPRGGQQAGSRAGPGAGSERIPVRSVRKCARKAAAGGSTGARRR